MRFLQRLNATHLYACGTHAFQPLCAAIVSMPAPALITVPDPDWSDLGPLPVLGTTALLTVIPQDVDAFTLPTSFEEGKEKCPYDPARGFTGLIIGEHTLFPTPVPYPQACCVSDIDVVERTCHHVHSVPCM